MNFFQTKLHPGLIVFISCSISLLVSSCFRSESNIVQTYRRPVAHSLEYTVRYVIESCRCVKFLGPSVRK